MGCKDRGVGSYYKRKYWVLRVPHYFLIKSKVPGNELGALDLNPKTSFYQWTLPMQYFYIQVIVLFIFNLTLDLIIRLCHISLIVIILVMHFYHYILQDTSASNSQLYLRRRACFFLNCRCTGKDPVRVHVLMQRKVTLLDCSQQIGSLLGDYITNCWYYSHVKLSFLLNVHLMALN